MALDELTQIKAAKSAPTAQHVFEPYRPIKTMAHAIARTRGFMLVADVDLIMKWVAREQPRFVVDLGAGSGTSSAAVLLASNVPTVITVDIDDNALNSVEQFLTNQGLNWRWQKWAGDSVEIAERLPAKAVDMLLIDTSHEYEHTVKELAAWRDKMADNHLLFIHDYFGRYQGVAQAVDEALARDELETFECAGWSWIGRYKNGK